VVPGLLRRTHEAKTTGAPELTIWGTGRALREFMHVDDCADALVFLMRNYSEEHLINVGTVSIGELAKKVSEVVGYSGCFIFDTSKPDGMPRKLLDSSRMLKTGWRARNALDDGLAQTYQWFLAHELMADSTRHYAAH
jgi:GDP-L-fucose synthase